MSYLENQTRPNTSETYYIARGETLTVGSPLIIYSADRQSELLFTVADFFGEPNATMELNNRNTGGLNLRSFQIQFLNYQDDASIYFNSPVTSYPTFDMYSFGATFNVPVVFCNRQEINQTNQYITQSSDTQGGIYWASAGGSFGTVEYSNGTGVPDRLNIYTSPNATGANPVALQSNLLVYSDGLSTSATSCNFLANLSANNIKLPQTSISTPTAPGDGVIRSSPYASGSNCMDFFVHLGTGLTVGYNWFANDDAGSYLYATLRGGAILSNADTAVFTCANIYGYCNISSVAGSFSNLTSTSSASFCNGLVVYAGTATLNGPISVGGQFLINSGAPTPLLRSGLALCNQAGGYDGITFNGTVPKTFIQTTTFGAGGDVAVGNASGIIKQFVLPLEYQTANTIQVNITGRSIVAGSNDVSPYSTSFTYVGSGGSIGPPDGTWFYITGQPGAAFSTAAYGIGLSGNLVLATLPSLSNNSYSGSPVPYPETGNSVSTAINWPMTFTLCPRQLPDGQTFYVWCSLHNPSSHGGTINFDTFNLYANLTFIN